MSLDQGYKGMDTFGALIWRLDLRAAHEEKSVSLRSTRPLPLGSSSLYLSLRLQMAQPLAVLMICEYSSTSDTTWASYANNPLDRLI